MMWLVIIVYAKNYSFIFYFSITNYFQFLNPYVNPFVLMGIRGNLILCSSFTADLFGPQYTHQPLLPSPH